MNNKLKIIMLISITAVASSIVSVTATSMIIPSNPPTIVMSPSNDGVYVYQTGILPDYPNQYHPDTEYIMRHTFVSSSREAKSTYGYSDLDDRINTMRDFQYVQAHIGYDVPTELEMTLDKFNTDIKYIRENSNSPYYRDALEAYADAKGDAKKAVQIINELHPILLSPENHKSYQAFTIIEE